MSSEATNINNTESKPLAKWRDPEYVRKYYRERQRRLRGDFKLHPYVMEDGRKWSDHHPWGKFKTYEEWRAWKTSIAKPQAPRPKRMCELCNKEIYEARWANHEKSRPHQRMVDLLLRMGYARRAQTPGVALSTRKFQDDRGEDEGADPLRGKIADDTAEISGET